MNVLKKRKEGGPRLSTKSSYLRFSLYFFMFAKITGVVVVVAAAVLVVVEGRAVLENNGYSEFVVAISPDVPQAYN